jgi:Aminoglycoside-2''-adenylyltransferase
LDALTTAQLDAIAGVSSLLEREGLDYWLFGGWAVDFHVGRLTREHEDIDFAVWAVESDRIGRLLETAGWEHAPEVDEDGGTGYVRGGVRLELTFLVRDEHGSVRIPLRRGDVTFAGGSIGGDVLELEGRRCRVLDAESLMRTKSALRDEESDQAKDTADLEALGEGAPTARPVQRTTKGEP